MSKIPKMIAKLKKSFHKSKHTNILLIFGLTFIIYVHNLSPSVYGGDSGDFLSAIAVKGVPHPSGYPLFTMLGILFSYLPTNAALAWKVGLVCAISSSLAVVFIYLITQELTQNKLIATISSLTLAFTYPFWLYAEVVEVFALHSLFVTILIYFSIRYHKYKKEKELYLLSFFIGLSLTNNLVILLLFPAIGIFILITNPKTLLNYKLVFKCLLFLILGLTPYIYIPIAASQNPPINWGNAVNWQNFWALVLRKDYGWGKITGGRPYIPLKSLVSYSLYFSIFISRIVPFFSIAGVIYLLIKREYPYLLLLLTAFIFTGPLYLIYTRTKFDSLTSISTLERFFISPLLITIILFPFGILIITSIIKLFIRSNFLINTLTKIVTVTFSVIPLALLFNNFSKTNFRSTYIGDNLGKDVLAPLPNNSILLVSTDLFAFNTLYVQHSKNFRKDVVIPGKNTGYHEFLRRAGLLNQIDYQSYFDKGKNSIKKDLFYKSIVSLVKQNDNVFSETRITVTIDGEDDVIISVPHGLVFKLKYDGSYKQSESEFIKEQSEILRKFNLSEIENNDLIISESLTLTNIRNQYALAHRNTANFLSIKFKNKEKYDKFVKIAKYLDPDFHLFNRQILKIKESDGISVLIYIKR